MKKYRLEHPNPQFKRSQWTNLNGEWEFEVDTGKSGEARKLFQKDHLAQKINVPFCPESKLSGIENLDFLECVWYRRDIEIPKNKKGERVLVHFGAVDHIATVYVNGIKVGTHVGGYSSFSFDITDFLFEGKNSLCVCAVDETRNPIYGHGKQSREYHSHTCLYTRITGIWQTVWLEYVPNIRIKKFKLYPGIETKTLNLIVETTGVATLKAVATYNGKEMGRTEIHCCSTHIYAQINLSELHLWEVGNGNLYDLTLTYGEDEVETYFGMRNLMLSDGKFLINGKSVFQRLVLDQGYDPNGLYTAPSENDMIRDIQIALDAGFNGARLHQKVFEPTFLYHCDKMGYIVWGEYGNWGMDYSKPQILGGMLNEWLEILERDFNHPSIVGWCPFNETTEYHGNKFDPNTILTIYNATKAMDMTRPCIDASGWFHVVTDIYDIHDYTQDVEKFQNLFRKEASRDLVEAYIEHRPGVGKRNCPYQNQPIFISEFGGIGWTSDHAEGWGYGDSPTTRKEFLDRYRGLTDVLLDNPSIFGFCYTQLYDVEQEMNGLYTYAREPKFDMSIIKGFMQRKAKIEKSLT